jgi:nucleoside phosphorylase
VQNNIKFCLLSSKKRIIHQKEKEADIGIITALKVEIVPFIDNFKDTELERITSENVHYKKGVITAKNGDKIRFVTVLQEEMGTVDAAAIGAMLVKEFNIKHLFMIGVCGGRYGMVEIGDIVIPSDSVAYQRGKLTDDGLKMEVGHSQTNITPKMIFDNCDFIIDKIYKKYTDKRIADKKRALPVKMPTIHFEPIACGENVLDKENELENISKNVAQRKLCAIDMESYAIFRLHKFLDIKTIVIKSVMDLTRYKSDDYKEYAAYISANFLFEILYEGIYKVN